jgi:hypothetical protein
LARFSMPTLTFSLMRSSTVEPFGMLCLRWTMGSRNRVRALWGGATLDGSGALYAAIQPPHPVWPVMMTARGQHRALALLSGRSEFVHSAGSLTMLDTDSHDSVVEEGVGRVVIWLVLDRIERLAMSQSWPALQPTHLVRNVSLQPSNDIS